MVKLPDLMAEMSAGWFIALKHRRDLEFLDSN
jgi:hypothetical protein